jgi:putative pyruvate formate lyase activating enzyme
MNEIVLNDYYKECSLCPLNCKVDRTNGKVGICGQTDQLKVAWVGLHKGEEPPISGSNGSGTIFFSGCSLQCQHCQN